MTSSRVVLIAVSALAAIAAAPASAGTLTMQAAAGLGGVSKPGRWTPVRITIDNSGPDIAGVLEVTWGNAEVRREVVIPSPSRKQFSMYIRTADVNGPVSVRIRTSGGELRAADAPVRLIAPHDPATLCVGPEASDATLSCDARIAADALPEDARGYDAFDRVYLPDAGAAVEAPRLEILNRWKVLRTLEDSGALSQGSGVNAPLLPQGLPADSGRPLAAGILCYLAALVASALMLRRSNAVTSVHVVLTAIIAAGSTAALALGRVGPAQDVIVHHATLIQQLPGNAGSAVTFRGAAEFPALDAYVLRTSLEDAHLEPIGGAEKVQHSYDEHGRPVLSGTFGLGSRKAFRLHGFTHAQPVSVRRVGRLLRFTNRSSSELRDCRPGEGLAFSATAVLRPGETVQAEQRDAGIAGPVLTCSLADPPFSFSDARRPVELRGSVRLEVYLLEALPADGGEKPQP